MSSETDRSVVAAAAPVASILYDGSRTVVTGDGIDIGRDEQSALTINSDQASRHHARISFENGALKLTDLESTNGTFVNGERISGASRRLENGDTITIGGKDLRVLTGQETHMASRELPIMGTQVVHFEGDSLAIGRDGSNDVVLENPNVSRFHAQVAKVDGGVELRDLGSRNGTRLDGEPVRRARLETGSEIGVGPFRLIFDGTSFVARDDRGALRLDADAVAVDARGKRILQPISLSVAPGEFAAIIGESGAGKSTLIKALAGVSSPAQGRVTVNGEPVGSRLTDIGYVPQDDIVHRLLTVLEALRYAAKLRLPQDLSAEEVDEAVERVLGELSLEEHAATLVGSLSGGQRKRAGVATELLSRPGLLFLDEPTTGLDPALETRLMELFRSLADASRAVTIVTHATKNLALCDKLIVMGQGGHLVFCGSPGDALEFFGADAPDDIYTALEEQDTTQWRRRFEATLQPDAPSRTAEAAPSADAVPPAPRKERRALTQARVLAHRYLKLMLRDRRNLALLLGQVPLLALAIALLFPAGAFDSSRNPDDAVQLLFLVTVTTVWLGSISASRELIKERSVFIREAAVGARLSAYLLSKVIVLFALVALQTALLVAVIWLFHPLGEPAGTYLALLGTLVATGFVAIGMGLLVSAAVRSEDQATSFIPLVLIPQLLFAGSIVPVEQMGAAMEKLSNLVFTRWSFASVGSLLDIGSRIAADPQLGRLNEYGSFFDLSADLAAPVLGAFMLVFLVWVALLLSRRRAD